MARKTASEAVAEESVAAFIIDTESNVETAATDEIAEGGTESNEVDSVGAETGAETEESKPAKTVRKTPKKMAKVTEEKVERTFAQDDMILCKSVTAGALVYPAKKSGNVYHFAGYGDEIEICYGDLQPLLINRSRYLFDPLFVIEDDEVIEHSRWKNLKKFYDGLYTHKDVRDVIKLPPAQFEKALKELPKGLVNAVKVDVATGIENGTFDSIKKIEIMDRVLGTDFKTLL